MFWTLVVAAFWLTVGYLAVGLLGWMGASILALVVIGAGLMVTWLG